MSNTQKSGSAIARSIVEKEFPCPIVGCGQPSRAAIVTQGGGIYFLCLEHVSQPLWLDRFQLRLATLPKDIEESESLKGGAMSATDTCREPSCNREAGPDGYCSNACGPHEEAIRDRPAGGAMKACADCGQALAVVLTDLPELCCGCLAKWGEFRECDGGCGRFERIGADATSWGCIFCFPVGAMP